ncbi:MAG TPA: CheR family methyltransferase [Rhizomicrobium sp.]|jgi:chemotaxis protein methyltransferase CheR|nr:CheR family methyltransferase [Rhizomicrobium sp.]
MITGGDFDFVVDLLKARSGLALTPDRMSLVVARLVPVARAFGFRNLHELIADLREGREALARAVTESMTTNESSFFRDKATFDHFRSTLLPVLIARRAETRQLRIWSAAASTGQEVYSIAMILDDMRLAQEGWKIELLATDINSTSLARAKAGLYSQFEAQRGLPIQQLVQHFNHDGEQWRVDAALRDLVKFRNFNLLDPFEGLGTFDIIFCRNVLIYFDSPTKGAVLRKLNTALNEDGALILGATESTVGISSAFEPAAGTRGFYAKAAAVPRRTVQALPLTKYQ